MLKALFGDLSAAPAHHGWPRVAADTERWRGIGEALREGKLDLLGLWGDIATVLLRAVRALNSADAQRIYRRARRQSPLARGLSRASVPLGAGDRGSVRHRVCRACPIRGRGSITDAGPSIAHWPSRHGRARRGRPIGFLRRRARVCIRFQSARCMQGSSSPVISASRRAAKPLSGSRSAWATPTRASRNCCAASRSTTPHGLRRACPGTVRWRIRSSSLAPWSRHSSFTPPPRAVWLRAVMAELERIANHLGDIGAICNDAAFSMMHAECAILREEVLRACAVAFGHRLMMDRIVPGGIAADLEPAGRQAILDVAKRLRRQFPELIELYENTASLQDRTVGTGVVSQRSPRSSQRPVMSVGHPVAHSMHESALPYPPYDAAPIEIAVRSEGDVDARVWVRIEEIQHSIGWLEAALASLPGGPVHLPIIRAPVDERRRLGSRRGVSRRHSGVRAHRPRTAHRALPLARSVMVSVAAARGRHRGQHRCGLSRCATSPSIAPIPGMISSCA